MPLTIALPLCTLDGEHRSEVRNESLKKDAEELHIQLRQMWEERYETRFPEQLSAGAAQPGSEEVAPSVQYQQ